MEIILHRLFLKRFKKMPKNVRVKFVERKNLFRNTPFHPILNNHSVERAYPGCRSINVTGDYRAIFKQRGDVVVFVNIGTHSELYS
ncbi:MAG: type II toxin-antitoxin system YafQ family toxin [bacterium]|nr:type II toxin-antitoxin system YafQ family toxin [bacterium]